MNNNTAAAARVLRLNLNTSLCRASVGVSSLTEASKELCKHRDAYGYGASKMSEGHGDVTEITAEGAKVIARVSYNGRVWNLDGTEIKL